MVVVPHHALLAILVTVPTVLEIMLANPVSQDSLSPIIPASSAQWPTASPAQLIISVRHATHPTVLATDLVYYVKSLTALLVSHPQLALSVQLDFQSVKLKHVFNATYLSALNAQSTTSAAPATQDSHLLQMEPPASAVTSLTASSVQDKTPAPTVLQDLLSMLQEEPAVISVT